MQVGELVKLNTWYAVYENRGIGKVVHIRVWQESERNCGVDVEVLWSDGSIETFDEADLVYAVDDHEDW